MGRWGSNPRPAGYEASQHLDAVTAGDLRKDSRMQPCREEFGHAFAMIKLSAVRSMTWRCTYVAGAFCSTVPRTGYSHQYWTSASNRLRDSAYWMATVLCARAVPLPHPSADLAHNCCISMAARLAYCLTQPR